MPIASPEVYAEMLDRAKAGKFAYPAINCTSSQTIVAAIRGFAEAESDGIVQFSWGGAEFASGQAVKSMVAGAVALAEFAHSIAENYDVNIALHTDHCPKDKLPGFMEPLLKVSQERVAKGLEPLFQSHMWDGSAVPLKENMEISAAHARGVRQGAHDPRDRDRRRRRRGGRRRGVARRQAVLDRSRTAWPPLRPSASASAAATWSPRPSATCTASTSRATSCCTPSILTDIQNAVGAKYGKDKPFDLVFHGGSGSLLSEIREALDYGVVKMNIDTDTQYAFTRPVADHMFTQLRRRPEGRRRGRQQEAVRPARLGQAGRGRHGRPRRRRLPGPPFRRHQDVASTRLSRNPGER